MHDAIEFHLEGLRLEVSPFRAHGRKRPTAKSPEVPYEELGTPSLQCSQIGFLVLSRARMLVTNECMIDQSFQKTMADIESRTETKPRGQGVDRNPT